jgi:phage shock protein E
MSLNDGIWVGVAVAAVLFFLLRGRGQITGVQARALVSGGAKLIDVRSPGEFASGHLEGAKNIPIGDLERRSGELGPKEAPLVLYCASGMRSAAGAATLRRTGFTQVHNLGSMGRW